MERTITRFAETPKNESGLIRKLAMPIALVSAALVAGALIYSGCSDNKSRKIEPTPQTTSQLRTNPGIPEYETLDWSYVVASDGDTIDGLNSKFGRNFDTAGARYQFKIDNQGKLDVSKNKVYKIRHYK